MALDSLLLSWSKETENCIVTEKRTSEGRQIVNKYVLFSITLIYLLIYLLICIGWAYVLNILLVYHVLPDNPLTILLLCLASIGWIILLRWLFDRVDDSSFIALLVILPGTMPIVIAVVSLLFPPQITMIRNDFVHHDIYIETGQTLPFSNLDNRKVQILCAGRDGDCTHTDNSRLPTILTDRVSIEPGQSVSVTFDYTGDYSITSLDTRGMTVTIHVSQKSDNTYSG